MTSKPHKFDPRLAVASALLLALWCSAIARMWNVFPPDLSALYMAGHFYAEGAFDLVYSAPMGFFGGTPPDWQPEIAKLGLQGQGVLPYVYPPLWAPVLASLAGNVSPTTFFNIAAVVQATLFAASVLLAWRIAKPFALPLWAWLLSSVALLATSVISFTALVHLQPQITVVFLILLAFERYSARHFATAGAVLAVAAMLKLAPAALVLIFLLDRNWRSLASFAATFAVLAAIGLAVTGIALHQQFFASLAAASSGLFLAAITYSTEPLLYALAAWMDLVPTLDVSLRNIRIEDAPQWLSLANKAIFLCALVWMLRQIAALPEQRRFVARLLVLSTLLNLFGPLGWAHYYLLQLLLLPALVGLMARPTGAALIGLIGLLTSWPLLLIVQANIPGDVAPSAIGTASMLLLAFAVARGANPQGTRFQAPVPTNLLPLPPTTSNP